MNKNFGEYSLSEIVGDGLKYLEGIREERR